MSNPTRFGLLSCLALLAYLNGGGCAPAVSAGGDLAGIAPGGVQDVALARQQIESGVLPDPALLSVEGFLREHDIPLTAPPGAPEIFASVAGAWRKPFDEPAAMGEVYIGLGTTRDLDSIVRVPLNLVVLIDRSGSMLDSPTGGYYTPSTSSPYSYLFPFAPQPAPPEPDYPTKLSWARLATYRVIDQLNADDLLTVISFNDQARVDVDAVVPTDHGALGDAVAGLRAAGNTNLHAALERAFQSALAHRAPGRLDRVILLTDAKPTEGLQATGEFVSLVAQYAQQDVGLTLMGVGTDFGIELGLAISALRGGTSFFLDSQRRIDQLIGDEFRFFVTPAAFDLTLQVTHNASVGIREVYGVSDYAGSASGATITLPTLFFSRREGGGAIVVRFSTAQTPDFSVDRTIGSLRLTYALPDKSQAAQTVDLTIPAGTAPGGEPPWFFDPAARRAAVLLDTALGLHSAAELAYYAGYGGDNGTAVSLLRNLLSYFDVATLGLSDQIDGDSRSLSDERRLIQQFLALLGG